MTQASFMRDVRDPLGLHFNRKYLKSGKKWLSYCQFNKGRLRDSSEYNSRCKRYIRASFESKRSEIGPETAELANLPMGGCMTPVSIMQEVWDPLGLYLNQKISKIGPEMAKLQPIYQRKVA